MDSPPPEKSFPETTQSQDGTSFTDSNENDDPGVVNLKIVDANGEEVFFKIKRTTKMKRLFHAYCKRVGLDISTIRFFLDGRHIDDEDTPDSLVLKDGSSIDAFVKQVAG